MMDVHDGHRLLLRELDGWSVWNIEIANPQLRHLKLADMSQKFLETYAHLVSIIILVLMVSLM